MPETYDLIVIGGGSAGLVAAGGAATLGARVALVEKKALGGDCLYTGCVPSKTMIKSARFAHQARDAEKYGFKALEPEFLNDSFASITNRVQSVIEIIEHHDAPEVFEKMGVEVIFGTPKFLSGNEIEVALKGSDERRVMRAKRFCIATGSRPFTPPIEGLEETGYITNEEVFHLKKLPARLLVLGAGAIGAELGQSFARFGSRVTIVEMNERILSKEDREVSALMEKIFRDEGIEILTSTKAVKFRTGENGAKIATCEAGGKTFEIEADEILAAVGRQPNLDGLELEKAGVRFDKKQIETDEYLRTSNKNIFAAGDVTGSFPVYAYGGLRSADRHSKRVRAVSVQKENRFSRRAVGDLYRTGNRARRADRSRSRKRIRRGARQNLQNKLYRKRPRPGRRRDRRICQNRHAPRANSRRDRRRRARRRIDPRIRLGDEGKL